MKILHIVINGTYTPGMAYQDNILPRYHALAGHQVTIMASCRVYDKTEKKLITVPAGERRMPDGELLIRVPFRKIVNAQISDRLRLVPDLEERLEQIAPEFILLHGVSTLSIPALKRYMEKHPSVRLIIDNHADFSNSGTNPLSHYLLHRGLWRRMTRIIAPVTETFYGVIPARVDFLINEYGAPRDKCALLLMGADDELAEKAESPEIIRETRERYGIGADDFLIVTGGAINQTKKQTLLLMQAVKKLAEERVKLLIFGSVSRELREEFDALTDGLRIRYIGWQDAEDTYPVIAAADLAVYPGRHSTLWEQTAGQGIPMVCKYWDGTTHVDGGGNVRFIYHDSTEEILEILRGLLADEKSYRRMKTTAGENRQRFSYRRIAEESLAVRGVNEEV